MTRPALLQVLTAACSLAGLVTAGAFVAAPAFETTSAGVAPTYATGPLVLPVDRVTTLRAAPQPVAPRRTVRRTTPGDALPGRAPVTSPLSYPLTLPLSTGTGTSTGTTTGTSTTPTPGTPAPSTPAPTAGPTATADVTVASFNALGSSHTRGGARGMQPGPVRAGYAAQVIAQHDLDLIGFQELQHDQLAALQTATDGAFRFYPGTSLATKDSENSVAWRDDTWELMNSTTLTIPYFHGQPRRMPIVTLRHRATGATVAVLNVHNPATTRRWGNNQVWRTRATALEVAAVQGLVDAGTPVIFTGDFNEREEAFCAVTADGLMHASAGGSHGATCAPPAHPGIDWVFGTRLVTFSSHTVDRSALVRRTTDHPVVVAQARVTSPVAGPQ